MAPLASPPDAAPPVSAGPAADSSRGLSERPPVRIPPRFWWLKRLTVAGGLYLLLLASVRLWWGYEADRRLQAEIDAIRGRGEPLLLEDYDLTVPAHEDAGPLLQQTIAALPPHSAGVAPDDLAKLLKRGLACNEAVQRFLAETATARQLLRAAAQRPRATWGLRLTSPMINLLMPSLSDTRRLAKVAAAAALAEYAAGDDAAAFATVRDALALARQADDNNPFLISRLVAVACEALATDTLAFLVAQVEVDDAPPQPLVRRRVARVPATRAQLLELRDRLLDEVAFSRGLRAAMQGERSMIWDTMSLVLAGRQPLVGFGPAPATSRLELLFRRAVYDPAIRLELWRMLVALEPFVAAGTAENGTKVCAPALVVPDKRSMRGLTRFYSAILLPSLDRSVEIHFRQIGFRRLTATAIAIRLYELDHRRRPETLAALVPEYLPAVPRDPFRADGGPIGYLRDDEIPRLYCVGSNGLDENGLLVWSSPTQLDPERSDWPTVFLDGRQPWERVDVFAEQRVLKVGPPAPGESSEGGAQSDADEGQRE